MTYGLFPRDEFESKVVTFERNPDCSRCGLHRGCNFPKMDVSGKGQKKILLIGEAPGHTEDQEGEQFVGKSGQFLKKQLFAAGIKMNRDCWKINAVNCYPKGTPTKAQIRYCRPYVDSVIKKLSPNFIVLVGGKAVESFYMNRFSRLGITRWRGHCYPDKKGWIIPIVHPSFVLRKDDRNLRSVFDRDMKYLASCLLKTLHKRIPPLSQDINGYDDQITLLWEHDQIVSQLEKTLHTPPNIIYFDYETTDLKPQRPTSKIVSIAYAYDNHAYTFLYDFKDTWTKQERDKIGSLWRQILQHNKIKFEGQNIKFEDNWSEVCFNARPKIWNWDTMLAAHVIDNRSGITGLKFQVYKELGIDPYDDYIKQFMEGSPNKIEDAQPHKVLWYNARDALFGSMIAKKQKKRMHGKLLNAYRFFHGGVLAMSEIQLNGINISEDHYLREEASLDRQIKTTKIGLYESHQARQFNTRYGRQVNLKSTKDIGTLLSKFLNIKLETTMAGNSIVDKKALENIKHHFTDRLLHMRKLEKIQSTYISQFTRENINNKIYPFFDLHIPVSYRSSSSRPNFQNIPVRDELAKKVCRSGILPSKGNQLFEIDYSGIEVAISACYHKDPKMIKYIKTDPGKMHTDAAKDIWMLDEVSESIRFYAKNCWVFPQFYGSYYKECAKDLWNNCIDLPLSNANPDPEVELIKKKLKESVGDKYNTLREHIRKKHIRGRSDFEHHCQEVEKKFWSRFNVYREWKKEINQFYRTNGYIETHLGFKCRGIMSENDATNYQIQGTAFHCLLWLLVELMIISQREDWRTKIIGQVHDSIVFDLYPPEGDHILKTVRDIGTIKIRQQFPWIIVPLKIDAEITPINGSWYTKEKIEDQKKLFIEENHATTTSVQT